MKEIHIGPADLMSARNGTTTVVRVWGAGSTYVAFDVEGGIPTAPLDVDARVVLSPDDFQQIAENKGAGHPVTADDGTAYRVSVWA